MPSVRIKMPTEPVYIKQEPYIGDDGIYYPAEEYVPEGQSSYYKQIISKDLFIEAYNKWIKDAPSEEVTK